MSTFFHANAIPRRDGQKQDGIHLLWTFPSAAGFSVDGYDIERFEGALDYEISCYELTANELAVLHRIHHVDTPWGIVLFQATPCPKSPNQTPDQPYEDDTSPKPRRTWIDFGERRRGRVPNPIVEDGIVFAVRYRYPRRRQATAIVEYRELRGLYVGYHMQIELPEAACNVELLLANFAGRSRIVARSGEAELMTRTIGHDSEPKRVVFKSEDRPITALEIIVPQRKAILLQIHVDYTRLRTIVAGDLVHNTDDAVSSESIQPDAVLPSTMTTLLPSMVGLAPKLATCWVYDIQLSKNHSYISLQTGVNALGIAMFQGKAVDTCIGNGAQGIRFQNNAIDQVLVYVESPGKQLVICVDVVDEKRLRGIWSNAKIIAKNIQMPLRSVNTSLTNTAEENELAASRTVGDEVFRASEFQPVSQTMNASAEDNATTSPLWKSVLTRETKDNRFIDLRAWSYGMAVTTDPKWRRMLGFGFLDSDDDLAVEQTYNYRITGRFLQRDLYEQVYGFHTIPIGTTLPTQFDMGDLSFSMSVPREVEIWPGPSKTALQSVGRKGLRLVKDPDVDVNLEVRFSAPTRHVVLELGDIGHDDLEYEARSTGFIPGFIGSIQGRIPLQDRVELRFNDPIDRLRLNGNRFLYAVRFKAVETSNPDELVSLSAYIFNIKYEDSAPPPPPTALGTTNLQEPIIPGDPHVAVKNPPHSLGFRLNWMPPVRGGNIPVWPPDLAAVPPSDVLGYMIERRRVDSNGPFFPIDDKGTLFFGNRGRRGDVEAIKPGVDLFEIFPETARLTTPVDPHMDINDVLTDDQGAKEPPGSLHQYRIFSIDAIGRRSTNATIGSVVRLEKHIPPPPPVAPTSLWASASCDAATGNLVITIKAGKKPFIVSGTGPSLPLTGVGNGTHILTGPGTWTGVTVSEQGDNAEVSVLGNFTCEAPTMQTVSSPSGHALSSGVRARLIQASDTQHLTTKDKQILGNSQNAIIMEWAWRAEERKTDPYANEFRVYWHQLPPDSIYGQLINTATVSGGLHKTQVKLNQAVKSNQLRGQFINAGGTAFKVESNTAGASNITVHLHPSKLKPSAVPQPATLVFNPLPDGSERRPENWTERVGVIPITAVENYTFIFRDLVTLDAVNPRARIWVGVSAADDQSYVADEIPSTSPQGGRPGNESSIATITIEGRYIGQPTFTVSAPLPDVPELLTDEPTEPHVSIKLDLPALLSSVSIPAGHKVLVERLPGNILMQMISVSGNAIKASFPDGMTFSYTLSKKKDRQDFLTQIQSGEPGRIEGRFLMDFVIRFRSDLGPLWQPTALRDPVTFGAVTDVLPADSERYFYRIRLVDQAGHVSTGDALFPVIVRVVSLRMPAAPDVHIDNSDDDNLLVRVSVNDAYDLHWALLFQSVQDAATPLDEELIEKAQLLRLPNRRDLYPNNGYRLRLQDGTLLAPSTVLDVQTGTLIPPTRELKTILTPGFDKRVAVWAIALTRDGINSRFSGPHTATTTSSPLEAPLLTVIPGAVDDSLSWTTLAVTPAEISIERSTDGTSWQRVSPWLPDDVKCPYTVAAQPGARQYRLVLRAQGGRTAVGALVEVN